MGTEETPDLSAQSGDAMAETVAIACQLAGRGEIGWVQVVSGSRPTYGEVVRFRRWADANRLGMTVTASGVTIQPRRQLATAGQTRPPGELLLVWSAALGDRLALVLNWVRSHSRPWCADGGAMSEGTR